MRSQRPLEPERKTGGNEFDRTGFRRHTLVEPSLIVPEAAAESFLGERTGWCRRDGRLAVGALIFAGLVVVGAVSLVGAEDDPGTAVETSDERLL